MRDFNSWNDPRIERRLPLWRAPLYYTYVLQSLRDNKLYIGSTSDLKKRFHLHKTGQVFATKGRLPLKLIFYEAFVEKDDSLRREKYFKTDPGKKSLKLILRKYLSAIVVSSV